MDKIMDLITGKKFLYSLLAVGVFLSLALTGTVVFTSEESMTFILGLFGINVTGHALTDVAALIARAFGRNALEEPEPIIEPEPAPEPEPEEEDSE